MSSLVAELNTIHPLDCRFVSQVRAAFADYPWFYDRGYIRYCDGTKSMLREHQRVAVAAFGVPAGYHVHHKDGDRLNNCANNLAVLSATDHLRLHGRVYQRRIVVVCPICGSSFEAKPRDFEQRNKAYCSPACRGYADRKVDRPSPERLAALLIEIGNWRTIGGMFSVSDNAVRKWARVYGLDLSVCDGRRK